ncbi:hypothetical protein WR25_02697 [Diploscapter pachys]|uniref:Uncharacterized protein n=1 Tax=Diploscapter pachys TaxID=2018661 RepID=A0A2A2K1H7_9BILA|nr:hypothetical protein WR25_02697 [Diploscapter pachys]
MNWMSGAAKWQKLSKVQTPAAQSFEGIVWSGSYGGCVVPTTCRSFTVAYAQDAVAACGMAWRRSMAARIAADVACGRRLASTSAMLELPPGAITALSRTIGDEPARGPVECTGEREGQQARIGGGDGAVSNPVFDKPPKCLVDLTLQCTEAGGAFGRERFVASADHAATEVIHVDLRVPDQEVMEPVNAATRPGSSNCRRLL